MFYSYLHQILYVCLVLSSSYVLGQAPSGRATQSMRAFMENPIAMDYYRKGGATYVANRGDDRLFSQLSYDYYDLANAVLTDTHGNTYESLARYNRVTLKVEIFDQDRKGLFAIKETELPYVTIGDRRYQAVVFLDQKGKRVGYVELQATTPDSTRTVGKLFQIYQASNVTADRGIVNSGGGPKFKIDSTSYLIGFKPYPIAVPRRAKHLVGDLATACQRMALDKAGKYRRNEDAFWQQFIAYVAKCE